MHNKSRKASIPTSAMKGQKRKKRRSLETDAETLERVTTDNPAMTAPASLMLSSQHTRKQQSLPRTEGNQSSTPAGSSTVVTDPAGDEVGEDVRAKSKYEQGWRHLVRNFSPSWFSVTMGTGIVSVLLITIPFHARWLYWLSVIFFCLNGILFTLATIISTLRYTLYPEIWTVMIHDPTNSLFLGTAPMGFATLIESWIFLCCPYWGQWATTLAWVAWMLDAICAFAVTTSLSFILISQTQIQSLDRITAAQLLPIAATIVAAGTGAEVAEQLLRYNAQHALGTLITGYVMWGMATPFAMVTLVIYYQRLAVHKLPPREIIVSSFLPLGPLGMGGYTIMYLGKITRETLPHTDFLRDTPLAGDALYIFGTFTSLIMWGFGTVWFVYALAAIYSCGKFPFNMGWWGFTFPLGVFSVSTITFGVEFPSLVFRVLGTIFSVMVILLWIVVFVGTMHGAWKGTLFYAACLKNLPMNRGLSDEEAAKDKSDGDLEKAE